MAKETQTAPEPKKRRWYNNLADAYRVTKRSYPYIGWVIIGVTLAVVLAIFLLWWFSLLHTVAAIVLAISFILLIPMAILAALVKRAMYKQIDGTMGAVYGVITQIRRGWTVDEEPIAANRQRDLVWRIIGRPGIVLLAEGPKNRVRELVERETREVKRVIRNVPVHTIYVGHGDGQVPLTSVEKELRRLPKELNRNEVPLVVNRLQAMKARRQPPIPHGVDPSKMRVSRRALRGR